MKKIVLLLSVLLPIGLNAQMLIPYRLNDKWGYADESGKVVVIPNYTSAGFFRTDGYALVTRDSLVQLVDKSGKEFLPGVYTAISEFSNGLASVCRGGKYNWIQGEIIGGQWGFINTNFEEVIPCQFSRAESFVGDYAIVQKDDNWGPWGLIDKTGKTVLPFKFESYSFDMRPFPGLIWGPTEGTLQQDLTHKGEIWQIIDLKGRPQGVKYKAMHGKRAFNEKAFQGEDIYSVTFPQKTGPVKLKDLQGNVFMLERAKTRFNYLGNNLFYISIPSNDPPSDSNPDDHKYALINQKGDMLVDFGQYDYYGTCIDNRISVMKNGLHGYVDCATGKEIVSPKYDYSENYKNGYAHVYYNYSSRYHKADGFINYEGREFFYDDPVVNVVFHNGVQILDEHNTLLSPPWLSIENIISVSGSMVKLTNREGALLALGKIEGKINEFNDWEEYCCRLYPNSKLFNTIDTATARIKKIEISTSPDVTIQNAPFSESWFLLTNDGKTGLMNSEGKVIIPIDFDQIETVSEIGNITDPEMSAFLATKLDKKSTYGITGKEIIPMHDLLEAHLLPNGKTVFLVTDGDLTGTIDDKGKVLIPMQYSRIEPLDEGSKYQLISDNRERTGVVKNYSEIIVPGIYTDVNLASFRNRVFFRVFTGKYTLLLDSLGKTLVPKEYADGDLSPAELDIHDDNQPMYFLIYNKKKWGAFRPDKGLFIPISKQSLDIYAANEKVYFTYSDKSSNGPFGIMDADGKIILPPVYTSIDFTGSPEVIAVVNDKEFKSYNFTSEYKLVKIEE